MFIYNYLIMKTLLKFVLVIWMIGSTWYYLCVINHNCTDKKQDIEAQSIPDTKPEIKKQKSPPSKPEVEERKSLPPTSIKDTIVPTLKQIRQYWDSHPHFYFQSNEARLAGEANISRLVKDLTFLFAHEKGSKVLLTGHTDFTGSNALNYKLGIARAQHLKDRLVQQGLPADRIDVTSMGEEKPIADNRTPEGRKTNRRVEIHIIH